MSFMFCGTRPDAESGIHGFIPQTPLLLHAVRRSFANLPLLGVFSFLQLLIYGFLSPPPDIIPGLVWASFSIALILTVCITYQHLRAQARAHDAAASDLASNPVLDRGIRGFIHQLLLEICAVNNSEFCGLFFYIFFHLRFITHCFIWPQPEDEAWLFVVLLCITAIISKRIYPRDQAAHDAAASSFLAHRDHKVVDVDIESLWEFDSRNASATPAMGEEKINALPVHIYGFAGQQKQRKILKGRAQL